MACCCLYKTKTILKAAQICKPSRNLLAYNDVIAGILVKSRNLHESFKYEDLQLQLKAPNELLEKPTGPLVFGKLLTDHMLTVSWSSSNGWGIPIISPVVPFQIHPSAKVLHYAVEIFEGMKAYRGIDGKIRLFRPSANMKRMKASAMRSCLPDFHGDELIKCIKKLVMIDQEWVPHAENASLYLRPAMIGTEGSLGVAASAEALLFVLLCPVGPYFPANFTSVSLLAEPAFVRAWPGGCGDNKMGSNYGPTVYLQKLAEKQGFQQILWLFGEDHQITEAGTMNIFIIYTSDSGETVAVTPPLNGLILPGVTRMSCLELLREWGVCKVEERTILMKEVIELANKEQLQEIFGAGTACTICPVGSLSFKGQEIKVPLGGPDSLSKRLRMSLFNIYYGATPHSWAEDVTEI